MSDAAITTITACVIQVVTIVAGVVVLYIRAHYGEAATKAATKEVSKKIDENTLLTVKTANKADSVVMHTAQAVVASKETVEAVQSLDRKLNGGVDAAIEAAIKPLRDAFLDQAHCYDRDMKEMRGLIAVNTAALNEIRSKLK